LRLQINFFTIVITRSGVLKLVMVINHVDMTSYTWWRSIGVFNMLMTSPQPPLFKSKNWLSYGQSIFSPWLLLEVMFRNWVWSSTKVMLTSYSWWRFLDVFTMPMPRPHICVTFLKGKNSLSYGKSIFSIVINRSGIWKLVMVINQGDTYFLHLMKVHWCLHYANDRFSHVWNFI